MAKVINTSQQLTHAALAPQSIHSRVIHVTTFVTGGFGNTGVVATPVVADGVRLLSLRLLILPGNLTSSVAIIIFLSTGTGKIITQALVATGWDKIMQSVGGSAPAIRYDGGQQEIIWHMNVLYSGSGRRFGLALQNLSASVGATVWASFQISEG